MMNIDNLLNRAIQLHRQGALSESREIYEQILAELPTHAKVLNLLGATYIQTGEHQKGLPFIEKALLVKPDFPEACNNRGIILKGLGRYEEAISCYQNALVLNPNYALAYYNLGVVQEELKCHEEALASYQRALAIKPDYVDAHINLGNLLKDARQLNEAATSYRHALRLRPDNADVHTSLGFVLMLQNRLDEAEASLRKALTLNPKDANTFFTLGNILKNTGRADEAHEMFRCAQQLRPLLTQPGKKREADFSVLLLGSPIVACTPVEYLVGRAGYDSHFLALLPDVTYDIGFLRAKADVVINMISDADDRQDVLLLAQDIADQLGRPTVNHPRLVMGTDREAIAARLAGIARCRIPKTMRFSAQDLSGEKGRKCMEGFAMPLLIRCAGMHGGEDFEKIDDVGAIDSFVSHHPDADIYVIEYVDYRSADGYFRKYRMLCVDGEILPYHLAIHDHWMVHHFRTDMANQEWMRKEEEAFLKHPYRIFTKAHMNALQEMASIIGLDYFGIDCSLDREGNIVVFEANASMVIHDESDAMFAYKNPYVRKIKEAFDTMLSRLAQSR